MYQVTRKSRIKETLQLCHANGDVAEEIEVDLNVDAISGRMNKAYEALGIAQVELEKNSESPISMDKFGQALIAVFNIVFGEEGTQRILNFYENSYTEMLLDIYPFIFGEVLPKINEASEERKRQLVEAAKATKKRWFK